jgi:thiol-disulfide isomerase/thioredoxin
VVLRSILLVIILCSITFSCKAPVAPTELPDVQVKKLTGETVRLRSFSGHPLIVNFWATWCGPCRYEIPMLNQLQKKYNKGGLVIIGISTDEGGPEVVKDFLKEIPIEYRTFLKTPGLEEKFGGILGLPTTYFYDKSGNQVEKIIGLTSREVFEQRIEELLKN